MCISENFCIRFIIYVLFLLVPTFTWMFYVFHLFRSSPWLNFRLVRGLDRFSHLPMERGALDEHSSA